MKKIVIVIILILVCLSSVVVTYRYMYPFGNRYCTLACMHGGLLQYALEHDGWFPKKGNDSYGALQQLYPKYCTSEELAGISGDRDGVMKALQLNSPLNGTLTSWIYFQGFRQDDGPNVAILWESRHGLYPNGKRNFFGGHAVLLVGGDITNVPAAEWEGFLKQQEMYRNKIQNERGSPSLGSTVTQ